MQQTLFLRIRQRYDLFIRKKGHIMRNPVFLLFFFSYVNNKDTDQPVHPRSLISAFVVRCLDSKAKKKKKKKSCVYCNPTDIIQ